MKNLLLIFLFLGIFISSQTYHAKVVGVHDGDTVYVLDSLNVNHKIRIAGIDAPESNQDFGTQAKKFVSDHIFKKIVTIKVNTHDLYGREVSWLYYENKNLSEELLKNGFAWHYAKYDQQKYLQDLEDEARKNKIGLWSLPNPVPPSEFRKQN